MPCYEPTESHKQTYIQETAQLLLAVALETHIFVKLETMFPDAIENIKKEAECNPLGIDESSTTPSLMCAFIKDQLATNKDTFETFMYNGRNKLSRQLADWWEEHQKRDAERNK